MKARKISYWIGLFCLAMLVLMPDITVNAQPDPGGQGTDGQIPDEVGEGTDTQTPEGQQPPEEQQTSSELEGVMRPAEQSLVESGCLYTGSMSSKDGAVWNDYYCPRGSRFEGGEPGGKPGWSCLVSPDRASWDNWMSPVTGDAEIRRGECVIPIGGGGGIIEPTENGQSPREINVTQLLEPAASDSQGDQQQVQSDVAQVDEEAQGEEAQGEEAQDEENNASNQSQENKSSKQGYGCSANP
jgi:hypothetical protein